MNVERVQLNRQLGTGLRRLRLGAGLTQDELAAAMGLTGRYRRRQKLDLTLIRRVRSVVVREFTRLVRKRPELFGTGNRGVR